MEQFSLKGKKAIVTGGGSGIGFSLAQGLLEAGAEVAIIDVSHNVFQAAKELEKYGRTYGIQGDLLDRDIRKTVFLQAVDALGGNLDILLNNAGMQKRGYVLDFAQEDWDRVLELNLNAVFSLCQYAGEYMVAQKHGKIINIASINSFFGGTNVPAYSASKGAVVQLTKAIANEWSQYNINVNCIAPGFIETSLTKDMQENPQVYNGKLSRIPIGRWGTPEDLKGVVQFLASSASDYICGVVIPVDGGYLCK